MKEVLAKLYRQVYLDKSEAKSILGNIAEGKYEAEEISSFLTVFKMRNITVDELMGFRDCLIERSVKVNLSEFDPIDLCGTGGDGKDTFNISTLAAFVVSGAGYKVAKHGNYGVSSSCGSSNVMQHLGYEFTSDSSRLKRQIEEAGICFLHAPLFHPAMKEVAPIRKKLGVSTFFNMLGPMVNPSSPRKQLIGVFSNQLLRYYKYIYEQGNSEYRILYNLDGYDEISLTNDTKIVSPHKEYLLSPNELIPQRLSASDLKGGHSIEQAAKIFTQILEGEGTTAQNQAVAANAAMAIQCCNGNINIDEAFDLAMESIKSKNALKSLKKIIAL